MTEKQYIKEKNEKLNAKKEDAKSLPKHEVKAEAKKDEKEEKVVEKKVVETNKKDEIKAETTTGEKEEKKEGETKAETIEEKKEEKKKVVKKPIVKKDKAIVNGKSLGISKKHSMAICDYIRGKEIEEMMIELMKVVSLKKAIPMKGEIPHRKGKIMSGRYPVNASKVFIKLLKTLNANCSVNGLENPRIVVAIANDASRPFKRGGSMRFKRTNVYLEARELNQGSATPILKNKEKK
ncbi:MAG: hypothetical protein ABH840_03170 [Nanoarchaeota archaeon]